MDGGRGMGTLIFFAAAFIALLTAAFMYANSESSKATSAEIKASEAIAHIRSTDAHVSKLETKVLELSDSIKKLVEVMSEKEIEKDSAFEKQKQKLEWLEMKAAAQPLKSSAQRVIITQEKPLQINVLYRKAQPKPRVSVEMNSKAKDALIQTIKKKVSELSQ